MVHRREHRRQSSPKSPLSMEQVYSVHLAHEKQLSQSRRIRKRRKRRTPRLLRFFTFQLALLCAGFHAIMGAAAPQQGTRRKMAKRLKLSSAIAILFLICFVYRFGRCFYQRRALHLLLDPQSGFHPHWHPRSRHTRFPDVQTRVKIYMSNWYLPPCPSADDVDDRVRFTYHQERQTLAVSVNVSHNENAFDTYTLNSDIKPDLPLILRQDMVDTCLLSDKWFNAYRWIELTFWKKSRITDHFVDHQGMRPYCEDAVEILSFARHITQQETNHIRRYLKATSANQGLPILAQFGDEPTSHLQHIKVPYFKKFRTRVDLTELYRVTMPPEAGRIDDPDSQQCTSTRPRMFSKGDDPVYSPILWVLRRTRHFGGLSQIPAMDTAWEAKEDKAVWRGTLTGIRAISVNHSDYVNCMKMLRCRVAYKYDQSSLVDAGLAHKWPQFPATINGRSLVKGFLSVSEQLRCKAIIILEGNDVATGLKWALLSRSVVMMPPPTVTSWLMEEILEPWVHYIPLDKDGSNAEERVQWMIDNDEKTRKIAERATLFMYDLMFHPDADADDIQVKTEIMRRYQEYFVQS